MKLHLALVLLFSAVLGLAPTGRHTATFLDLPLNPGTNVSARVSNTVPLDATAYVADDRYKLRPGDRVSFRILEDTEPSKSLVVADSGELDVPYIGRVAAAEKSCKELAADLKARLEKEYYYRATIILALDTATKTLGRVYVWGQVRNQGVLDVIPGENLTAGKAILRAGGFADFANKKRVKVVRAPSPTIPHGGPSAASANRTGPPETFVLNLAEVLEEGRTEKDLPLRPDDLIIVPSRLINF